MQAKEGDEVTSNFDGEEFIIIRIVNSIVILDSKRGGRQILTGTDSLGMFYQRKEETHGSLSGKALSPNKDLFHHDHLPHREPTR